MGRPIGSGPAFGPRPVGRSRVRGVSASRWSVVPAIAPRFGVGFMMLGEGSPRPDAGSAAEALASGLRRGKILAGSRLTQKFDLVPGEGAALAHREVLERDRADGDPAERHDLMPKLGEHPANFALFALGEHQFDHGRLALAGENPSSLGADLPVGEPDSFGELGGQFRARQTRHERPIDLFDAILGMGQAIRELAVVGHEDEAGAVLVEPSHAVNSFRRLGKQVNDAWAARGVGIGRDIALGLMDGVIDGRFEGDCLAIDGHPRGGGVDTGAEHFRDLAINGDPSLENELFAGPSRAQAGAGQDLLQSLGMAGGERLGTRWTILGLRALRTALNLARGGLRGTRGGRSWRTRATR